MVWGDCKKQQQNILVILSGGGKLPSQLPCHCQQSIYYPEIIVNIFVEMLNNDNNVLQNEST